MTRRSKRELESALDELDDDEDDEDGFHYFVIGGDPDPDVGGYYTWSSERGVYVNDDGHELDADAEPDSEFSYNVRMTGGLES
ncbi:hypothetical protein HWV07_04345 [Natronomonas salina]|uniref:hypothetical protein n=1 Tax=Natronomonas salina TaxID=1710540 RepID=UPI0015B59885|nr:hypothetical protein [Natronomonas salina]QLD88304.1 hypothetical protein HWV07_04345 [Natronomonas salina]